MDGIITETLLPVSTFPQPPIAFNVCPSLQSEVFDFPEKKRNSFFEKRLLLKPFQKLEHFFGHLYTDREYEVRNFFSDHDMEDKNFPSSSLNNTIIFEKVSLGLQHSVILDVHVLVGEVIICTLL